jgi:hypothetical protein
VSQATVLLRPDDDPRFEPWLQLVSRFTALLRSGRAYAVDHAVYTQLLASYLDLLAGALATHGRIRLHAVEGDACVNGARLPFRPNMERSLQQFVQELDARGLAAIEFTPGIALGEFRTFMGLFLPGELWRGSDLAEACARAGLAHTRVLEHAAPGAAEDAGAGAAPPDPLEAAREAWDGLVRGARELLRGDALDQGVELRHVRRLIQPLVTSALAGEHLAAELAQVRRGEPAALHAAHVTLAALCVARRLGFGREELAEVAVAALLHDAGHTWTGPGRGVGADHRLEGVRRVAWATTLSPLSLASLRAALEHHPDATGRGSAAACSQAVSIADAYVTLLARDGAQQQWLSPSGALARVLGPLRSCWHPALPLALVRALGLYPPGQVVELDDGSLARALLPDPDDPERPWSEGVEDALGHPVPALLRAASPLPASRHVVRALPRHEWPADRAA